MGIDWASDYVDYTIISGVRPPRVTRNVFEPPSPSWGEEYARLFPGFFMNIYTYERVDG